jgi:hypothetical protein
VADKIVGGNMKLGQTELAEREKEEASKRLLEQLRKKLYSDDSSTARRAAFNLSWMQEDGLDILSKALFSEAAMRTKSAAAYGLRKMNGRMKKMALELFKRGLKYRNSRTREVCKKALFLLSKGPSGKSGSQQGPKKGRFEIKDIPQKSRRKVGIGRKGGREHSLPSRNFPRR